MDFSAARIAGLEAELAALRGGAPASEGGGVQGPLAAPTPSNALAQALQVPGQGQVADNYLRPDKFVSACAHFGRHHPRGGNAQRAEPQELSPHDLAQSSAAYHRVLVQSNGRKVIGVSPDILILAARARGGTAFGERAANTAISNWKCHSAFLLHRAP